MHVFYTPDIQSQAELPEEEAAHAVRVLRLQTGDEVTLTDGKGNFYRAEISTATTKRCLVNILETIPQAPLWSGHLHIAMAPTKNMDRTEWFAEKATEIGFDELTFLNCRFPNVNNQNGAHCQDTGIRHQAVAESTPAPPERNDRLQPVHQPAFRRP